MPRESVGLVDPILSADGSDPLEELREEWEAVLSAEGLGERIYKKQIRQPRKTVRPGKNRSAFPREIVVDPQSSAWIYDQATPDASRAPESPLEAILRSPPYADPERDKETSHALREAMLDAMDLILGKDMAHIVAARHFAQATIIELAAEHDVPPSTMADRIMSAEHKLANELLERCPEVTKHLYETSKRINP